MTLPKDLASPSIIQLVKITWALSILLLYNQPGRKKLIPPQRPLHTHTTGVGEDVKSKYDTRPRKEVPN